MVMKPLSLKLGLTSSLHPQMRPLRRRFEITVRSFVMSLPDLFSLQKRYKTLSDTQTERDNLLFMNMIDLLFSFLLSIVGSRRKFFFR